MNLGKLVSARGIVLSILAVVCLAFGPAVFAQTSIWKGGTGNWTDNNWSGGAPGSTSNVYIDGGQTLITSTVTLNVLGTPVNVNTITLDAGDTLILDSSSNLVVNGTAEFNGTPEGGFGSVAPNVIVAGTLTLNGASSNSTALFLNEQVLVLNGRTFPLSQGDLDGSGSLTNRGLIYGSGTISLPSVTNLDAIFATNPNAPLTLTGTTIDNTDGTISSDSPVASVLGLGSGSLAFNNSNVTNGVVAGTVAVNGGTFTNVNTIGTLSLNGVSIVGGAIGGQVTATNGATFNGTTIGAQGEGFSGGPFGVTLTDGSSVALRGTNTILAGDGGGLTLGAGGAGVTITGSGTLINNNFITGTGSISPSITNNATITVGALTSGGPFDPEIVGSGTLSLNNVDNATGNVIIATNATLDLHGQISGGQITAELYVPSAGANGSTLSAEDNAVLNGVTINPDSLASGFGIPTAVTVTGGSTLGIKGTVTNNVNLILGTGLSGATLNDVTTTRVFLGNLITTDGSIVNNGTIQGGGNINVAIANNGAIIANDPYAPLVLSGNVTNPNDLSTLQAVNGGNLRLNSATVIAEQVTVGYGSVLSGNGTITINGLSGDVDNSWIVAPGKSQTFTPGTLKINGNYFQEAGAGLSFILDDDAAGDYSQLDVNGFAILTPGTTISASFGIGFDPFSTCQYVTGICETYDVLNGDISDITDASQLSYFLAGSSDGLTWEEVIQNNELLLELMGLGETPTGGSGGSGGNGGSGGSGSGGTSPTPEPSSLLLLGVAFLTLMGTIRLRRRGSAKSLIA
jgi:hypothetical protein